MNIFRLAKQQTSPFRQEKRSLVLGILALSFLVSACSKTDEVMLFEIKASKIITSTENPFINIDSVALSEQYLYVSDIHQIKVFDLQGRYIKSLGKQGQTEGQFAAEVIGLALNSRKELLAVDMQNQRVQVFDEQDNVIRTFGTQGEHDGQFIEPQGIMVDQFDLIYVSDKARSDVQVFSPQGEYLYRIGHKGSGDSGLLEPESMAMHNEKLYIADEGNHRIQVFTPRGVYLQSLPGFGTLVSKQMESSMDDIPYQTEFDKLYARTRKGDIEGIAFDNKGRLYFIDEDRNAVKIIKNDTVIAAFTLQPGIKSADGIAFSKDFSQLYIADQGNERILVLSVSEINKHIEKD
ncbi:MAG: NHL repeat-containing protein [gamma proteobacterium symbiont of Bathyaustriella thionipta]|nr:NHL repeat-containing protein [gamma proteobacterium symbiont of Bathyaustriella thionipta]